MNRQTNQDDYSKAFNLLKDEIIQAKKIAKEYGLTFSSSKRLKKKGWSSLISLQHPLETPEYRVWIQISMSTDFLNDGQVHISSLVQNIVDHSWQRDAKNVDLSELTNSVKKSLDLFEKRVKEHNGVDPKEYSKKVLGLQFDWDTERREDDEEYEYSTSFGTDNCSAYVNGNGVAFFEKDGKEESLVSDASIIEKMQQLENMYIESQQG